MMNFQIIIYVSLILNSRGEDVVDYSSEIGLNSKGLISKHGYPYQSYTVQTDDGYLLKLQRIPYGKIYTNNTQSRIPVILMPGIICDSSIFVNMGDKSLAFILADNGYDVWLANYRGSTLSRRHVSFNPDVDRKKFWNYSFQEIGYYDVPSFIDHILKITKQKKLHFIGHSQGMTTYFVMLSDKPQYAKKIRSAVALAPGYTTEHMEPVVRPYLSSVENFMKKYMEIYDQYEVFPLSEFLKKASANWCLPGSPYRNICAYYALSVCGWTPNQLIRDRMPVTLTNVPSGSSMKQFQHSIQLRDGVFDKFDYGVEENMKKYGQEFPPKYNLTNATPPIVIYHGDTDYVTNYKDTEILASQLPNLIERKLYPQFSHIDVIWGVDAPKLIFKDILNFFKLYNYS